MNRSVANVAKPLTLSKMPKLEYAKLKSQFVWVGVKVIIGIVILVSFHVMGLSLKSYFLRINEQRKTETVALIAIAKITYITFLLLAALLILRLFGVEIASIIAILSAIAFVLGMSLQGTLSDIASGVILALFQTYSIGDIIEISDSHGDGHILGKVVEFRFVNTIVQDVYSQVRVTIPNRKVQESIVKNYSSTHRHKIITDVLLSNTNKDFAQIIQIVKDELKDKEKYPEILAEPAMTVAIFDMSEVGTKMRITTPISNDDIVAKRAKIMTGIRNALAKNSVVLVDPF